MINYQEFKPCTHPKGIIPTCACGQNAICPVCGFGKGAFPCDCSRVEQTVKKYKERFPEAWEKLADNPQVEGDRG